MNPIKRIIGITGLLVALVAAGLAWALVNSPDQATVALTDGSLLTLEKVSYGKEHAFKRTVVRWPWPFPDRMVSRTRNDRETLAFWLTLKNPVPGKSVNFNLGYLEMIDMHGCRYRERSHGSMHWVRPNHRILLHTVETFPRREETVQLELHDASGQSVGTLQMPVPENARGPFPKWTPDPLPSTKRAGDLEVTLKDIETYSSRSTYNGVEQTNLVYRPLFEARHEGRQTGVWRPEQLTISDATGNIVQSGGTSCEPDLCPYEPAWKMEVKWFRTAEAEFAAPELWKVGTVTWAGKDSAATIGLSNRIDGVDLEGLMAGGAGTVVYTNTLPGHYSTRGHYSSGGSSGTINGEKFEIDLSTQYRQQTVTVTSSTPFLSLLAPGKNDDQHVDVLAVDASGKRIEVLHHNEFSNRQHFWFLKGVQPGQPVDLTLAVHRGRRFEFYIKPDEPTMGGR